MSTKGASQPSSAITLLKTYFSITDIILLLLFLLIFISLVVVAVKYDVVSSSDFSAAKKNYPAQTQPTTDASSITTMPYTQITDLTQELHSTPREVTHAQ